MSLMDKAKDVGRRAKHRATEVAGEIAHRAGPLAEKAGEAAAKGVDKAATRLNKATHGKYEDKIDRVSTKVEHVLHRNGHGTGETKPGA